MTISNLTEERRVVIQERESLKQEMVVSIPIFSIFSLYSELIMRTFILHISVKKELQTSKIKMLIGRGGGEEDQHI